MQSCRKSLNYSVCVHGNEGTCGMSQQCGSIMYLNNIWTTVDYIMVYNRNKIHQGVSTQQYLLFKRAADLILNSGSFGSNRQAMNIVNDPSINSHLKNITSRRHNITCSLTTSIHIQECKNTNKTRVMSISLLHQCMLGGFPTCLPS